MEKLITSYTGFDLEWVYTPSLKNIVLNILGTDQDKKEEREKKKRNQKEKENGEHYTG